MGERGHTLIDIPSYSYATADLHGHGLGCGLLAVEGGAWQLVVGDADGSALVLGEHQFTEAVRLQRDDGAGYPVERARVHGVAAGVERHDRERRGANAHCARPEPIDVRLRGRPVSDTVQQPGKACVLLAMHLGEWNGCQRAPEWRGESPLDRAALLVHWGELEKITYSYDLHAAKWDAAACCMAQSAVDRPEHVAVKHAHLVDYQCAQSAQNAARVLVQHGGG